LNNLYYDVDEDKIVFVNLYDNPKPVPSSFVKPDIEDDLVDFGILLVQLIIRQPKDTRESLIDALRDIITVGQLYELIHGEAASAKTNFHGTIYELIMRCFGKNIMLESTSP